MSAGSGYLLKTIRLTRSRMNRHVAELTRVRRDLFPQAMTEELFAEINNLMGDAGKLRQIAHELRTMRQQENTERDP